MLRVLILRAAVQEAEKVGQGQRTRYRTDERCCGSSSG